MDDNAVIEFLNRQRSASEAARVSTYTVWIHSREVTVTIADAGEGAGSNRYYAAAQWSGMDISEAQPNSDGYTVGNPDATVEMALTNLHWNVFTAED